MPRLLQCISLLALGVLLASCTAPTSPPGSGSPRVAPAEITFAVRPSPPIAGDDSQLVFTVRRDERLIVSSQAAAVVVVDMPSQPSKPQPVELDGDGSGHWWTTYTFPRAGGWAASVRVTQTGEDPVEASFDFDVAPP